MKIQKTLPFLLIFGSLIGIIASFILTIDTIKLIENPNVDVLCNINPFVSCSSVANTWQSKIFGFPNSLFGIVFFSMIFAFGLMLKISESNTLLPNKTNEENGAIKLFWLLVNFSLLCSFVFVIWFFYQSVYVIGSLCIYCMIVWIITWPMFLYTTIWNFKQKRLDFLKKTEKILNILSENNLPILFFVYLIAIFLILLQFKDFFLY